MAANMAAKNVKPIYFVKNYIIELFDVLGVFTFAYITKIMEKTF